MAYMLNCVVVYVSPSIELCKYGVPSRDDYRSKHGIGEACVVRTFEVDEGVTDDRLAATG